METRCHATDICDMKWPWLHTQQFGSRHGDCERKSEPSSSSGPDPRIHTVIYPSANWSEKLRNGSSARRPRMTMERVALQRAPSCRTPIRHPAGERPRAGKPFSPRYEKSFTAPTRGGWIPDQVRYDGELKYHLPQTQKRRSSPRRFSNSVKRLQRKPYPFTTAFSSSRPPFMRSATRKASSSAWSALRRGSQWVW